MTGGGAAPSTACAVETHKGRCGGHIEWQREEGVGWFGSCYGLCGGYPVVLDETDSTKHEERNQS